MEALLTEASSPIAGIQNEAHKKVTSVIEHPFQMNITVLNKCTFTPWQAYQTSAVLQRRAVRSYSVKSNGKKNYDGLGRLHLKKGQEERGYKGERRRYIESGPPP